MRNQQISVLTLSKTEIKLGMRKRDIGVVIPAYNAEATIKDIIKELAGMGLKKENIIVIDDGSADQTYRIVKGLGVTVIHHPKNLGKGASLKDGFNLARSRALKKVFTLDADAQHQVSEIKNFFSHRSLCNLLIGIRKNNLQAMPWPRRLVNRTVSLVVSLLSDKYIPDAQCGFRLIDLKIFDRIKLKTNRYQTESELLIKACRNKYRIDFIPITTRYNSEKSYIKPLIDTIRFINMAVRSLWR